MKRLLIMLLTLLIVFSSTLVFAADEDESLNIIADAFIFRPIGFTTLVIGSAVFVVTLPIAVISKSVPKTADELVVKPFEYTFVRPLGATD